MAKAINIHEFLNRFNEEYDFLYQNYDQVAGYHEAVDAFDDMFKNENSARFVREFAEYRGDILSSDRGAAAFMFALEAMA